MPVSVSRREQDFCVFYVLENNSSFVDMLSILGAARMLRAFANVVSELVASSSFACLELRRNFMSTFAAAAECRFQLPKSPASSEISLHITTER